MHDAIGRLIVCVALLAVICGCVKKVNWTEDVRLPDGRIVTLKRHHEFGGPYEIGSTPTESWYWFEFKHPDTGERIRWESTRYLSALVLLIDNHTPRVIASPNYSGMFKYKCPSPPYLLFEYKNQRWVEKPIQELLGRKIRPNILNDPGEIEPLADRSNRHLTAKETEDKARGHTQGSRRARWC